MWTSLREQEESQISECYAQEGKFAFNDHCAGADHFLPLLRLCLLQAKDQKRTKQGYDEPSQSGGVLVLSDVEPEKVRGELSNRGWLNELSLIVNVSIIWLNSICNFTNSFKFQICKFFQKFLEPKIKTCYYTKKISKIFLKP